MTSYDLSGDEDVERVFEALKQPGDNPVMRSGMLSSSISRLKTIDVVLFIFRAITDAKYNIARALANEYNTREQRGGVDDATFGLDASFYRSLLRIYRVIYNMFRETAAMAFLDEVVSSLSRGV